MLNLRPLALQHIHYSIGAHSKFHFWHDPWINGTSVLQGFDKSIVSFAEFESLINTGSYMENRNWVLPSSNHIWIIELCLLVTAINIAARDSLTWNNTQSMNVSVATIWNDIRSPVITAPLWLPAAWHPLHIPKCAFTLWLAFKERFLTKNRMLQFGMTTDLRCLLSNNAIETVSHLFSSCSFINDPLLRLTGDWTSYLQGQFTIGINNKMQKYLCYLYLAVLVYFLWKERNACIHDLAHKKQTPAQ